MERGNDLFDPRSGWSKNVRAPSTPRIVLVHTIIPSTHSISAAPLVLLPHGFITKWDP